MPFQNIQDIIYLCIEMDKAMTYIRCATYEDLPRLMEIYHAARGIMRDSGNHRQWNDAYPSEGIVRKDISDGVCRVLCLKDEVSGEENVIAAMAFIEGPDPTYDRIYTDESMNVETQWPDRNPYHVIHRIAAIEPGHNAAEVLINQGFGEIKNSDGTATIRIDTHADNVIMHHLLRKYGFAMCGVIRLADGAPRTAYIKTVIK